MANKQIEGQLGNLSAKHQKAVRIEKKGFYGMHEQEGCHGQKKLSMLGNILERGGNRLKILKFDIKRDSPA